MNYVLLLVLWAAICSGLRVAEPNTQIDVAPQATFVYPRFDCVDINPYGNGTAVAHFGYTSFQASSISIPQGSNNIFVQDPQFRNQPTVFLPGTHYDVF